jgi:hypothetical protein
VAAGMSRPSQVSVACSSCDLTTSPSERGVTLAGDTISGPDRTGWRSWIEQLDCCERHSIAQVAVQEARYE